MSKPLVLIQLFPCKKKDLSLFFCPQLSASQVSSACRPETRNPGGQSPNRPPLPASKRCSRCSWPSRRRSRPRRRPSGGFGFALGANPKGGAIRPGRMELPLFSTSRLPHNPKDFCQRPNSPSAPQKVRGFGSGGCWRDFWGGRPKIATLDGFLS